MKRLLAIALLLAACSAEKPAAPPPPEPKAPPLPTVAEAKALLEEKFPVSDYELTAAGLSLPVKKAMRTEPANDAVSKLARAKWLVMDGSGDVAPSAKASSDKRFIVRPNGVIDIVPLAKKELVDVGGVHADAEGNAVVDFTWKWIPNEIGALFADRYAGTQKSTATLIWDGTSWMVLEYAKA